jgi:hypothetical protein
MKKLYLLVTFLLVGPTLSCVPAFADASQNGCQHSDDRASGCSNDSASTPVPEPGSLSLLAAGILLVGGGAAIVGRRRLLHN